MVNLFDDLPARADEEIVTELLCARMCGSSGSSRLVSPRRQINHIIRTMMNGSCSSPARRVYGSRVKASVTFVQATMS
jgi:hypothetical protein